ncbi:MAG: YwmB family TATA-box binding protein [Clostridia bacterium]
MKRFVLFFLIVAFLIACFVPETQNFSLAYFFQDGEFSLFSGDSELATCNTWKRVVSVGQEWIATDDIQKIKSFDFSNLNARGEMVVVPLNEEEQANLMEMKKNIGFVKVFTEIIENVGTSEYGYTSKIDSYLILQGSKVNMQIVIRNDSFVVGTPVILGSY